MDLSLLQRLVNVACDRGEKPRVHPNGFIQLDLGDYGHRIPASRLHIWPDGDDIPRQSVATTIHDHKFDMRSTVITGKLIQREHAVQLDPEMHPWTHQIHSAQYPTPKQSILAPTGVMVHVRLGGKKTAVVNAGESYWQHRYTFHDTDWEGLTATVMQKGHEDGDHSPRVLVPVGQEPDNSFVRADAPAGLLWHYINRALEQAAREQTPSELAV